MVLMAKPLKTEPFALAFWKLFLQKNVPDPNRIYNLYQSQTGSIYRSVRAVLVLPKEWGRQKTSVEVDTNMTAKRDAGA